MSVEHYLYFLYDAADDDFRDKLAFHAHFIILFRRRSHIYFLVLMIDEDWRDRDDAHAFPASPILHLRRFQECCCLILALPAISDMSLPQERSSLSRVSSFRRRLLHGLHEPIRVMRFVAASHDFIKWLFARFTFRFLHASRRARYSRCLIRHYPRSRKD